MRLCLLLLPVLASCVAASDTDPPDSGVRPVEVDGSSADPSPDARPVPEVCLLWDDPAALDDWGRANLPVDSCAVLVCPGPLGPCEEDTCLLHVCHRPAPDAGLTATLEAWVEDPSGV